MRQYTRVSGVARRRSAPQRDSNSESGDGSARSNRLAGGGIPGEAKRSFIEKGLMINGGAALPMGG